MAQSLSQLFIHIVFRNKNKGVKIEDVTSKELYAYMGAIIKDNGSIPIIINGTDDHIHILCIMSKNISLSKLVEEIKRHSSRWIKTKDERYKNFSWQGGYGGFSVSSSMHDKTKKYIQKQKEHHKRMTFNDEYLMFLKEYGVSYDEKYLWTD